MGARPIIFCDVPVTSSLLFKNGRPETGSAKEIYFALIYGSYSGMCLLQFSNVSFCCNSIPTDDEYVDLVEDFLNVQQLIVSSKELISWMMDRYWQK